MTPAGEVNKKGMPHNLMAVEVKDTYFKRAAVMQGLFTLHFFATCL